MQTNYLIRSASVVPYAELLVKVLFFLLIYKNVLAFLIPFYVLKVFISGLFFIFLANAIVVFCFSIYHRRSCRRIDFLLLLVLSFLVLNALVSFFVESSGNEYIYVLKSFSQFFIPFGLFFSFIVLGFVTRDFLIYLAFLALPVFLMGSVEVFAPIGLIKEFNRELMMIKIGRDVPFELGSYIFQDFGLYAIRSGSIFFEPLTLSIFAIQMFILMYCLEVGFFVRLFALLSMVFSLGKSGFLIAISSALGLIFKNTYIYVYSVVFLIGVLAFVGLLTLGGVSLFEGEFVFYTIGPHVNGLISGLINGLVDPILGHGLGTSGYLSYNHALVSGDLAWFSRPNDLVSGNGTESFIGMMVYQLGYLFLSVYLWLNFKIMYRLSSRGNYIVLGYAVGFLSISFLTESVITMLLFLTNYLIIYYFSYVYE